MRILKKERKNPLFYGLISDEQLDSLKAWDELKVNNLKELLR